jgi:hypothetical protein
MPWSFIIPAAASLIGGSMQASAAKSAAATSAASADRATALQERMYEEGVARQRPYYEIGVNALRQLPGRTGAMPTAFQYRPEQLTTDPGYQFRLSEGLKALERSAAARGGLMSGATGRALTRYGQEMGSQEYQNAYNRALTEYNAARAREAEEYNRLSGLAGVGGTTAQQITSAGQQMASNVGNIGMGQAQIAGQARMAAGSAYGRSLGDIGYLAGRYYGQPGTTNYLAPVEDRSVYPPMGDYPGA